MQTLNLGVLAHVDAGKTSLTERLLHAAGVIDEVGRVDDGTTQTDSLPLEQQRGITIRSAVVSFTVGDIVVNLIDTPGHPDFIAEVERVLAVLDGCVLVVSAVEGVQAQTRVLMRALQRLGIPTLIFVNKIDRAGARPDAVHAELVAALSPAVIAMGTTLEPGSRNAAFRPYDLGDSSYADRLAELLGDRDEALLDALLESGLEDRARLTPERLRAALLEQTRAAQVHPVFAGSAATGAGVAALMTGLTELLPLGAERADGTGKGIVFKVERGRAGERIAYLRMASGQVRVRERVRINGVAEATVTGIRVFEQGAAVERASVGAGRIARVWGLSSVRIGDVVGDLPNRQGSTAQFAPPSLETVIDPCRPQQRGALHAALAQLAEQDPLIDLRQDDLRREISVSLYGEVQKEVVQATLADEYGIEVTFRETTTICVERPVATGSAFELIATGDNPFLATVGLRVDPAPVGSGSRFELGVELGSMPPAFLTAVAETVTATLREGLRGWQVLDCVVTMTHSGYWARQSHAHGSFDASMSSTASDFRALTPLVLMSALAQAGTHVCEPVHRFELELPADTLGPTLSALSRVRAVPMGTRAQGSSYVVSGDIPAARVHALQRLLPTLTHGQGILTSAFERYDPVQGAVPQRRRTDHDPLDRRGYPLRVGR